MGTTYYNSKVYFSPGTTFAQGTVVTKAQYEAINDWVEMDGLISAPAFGAEDQYVSQSLLDQTIESSQKTVATAAGGGLVAEYRHASANQPQWATAGEGNKNHALKQELADAPDVTQTNTIHYAYGLIGRQRKSNADSPGAFVNIIQPIKLNSHELAVAPEAI